MVIFRRKQKIKQLEAKINEECGKLFDEIKNLKEELKEMRETVENLSDDTTQAKSAKQLMREYFYGKDDN